MAQARHGDNSAQLLPKLGHLTVIDGYLGTIDLSSLDFVQRALE
jgi:hypothetical protein